MSFTSERDVQEDTALPMDNDVGVGAKWLPTVALSEIEEKAQISSNVFLVTWNGRDETFIYKTVEHPFYDQSHTALFQQELRNIVLLQGIRNIVQLVAVVKSPSPFKTAPLSEGGHVILGMVLEYHPNGTLEDAIHRRDGKGTAWQAWPYQLARALLRLHDSFLTHMDITPRKVIIDAADEGSFH
ncbi:hypothetical protein BDV37DRAFT_283971 [Aspergillus pseudonomiae]|uniref:Protein kinase domain-containing protein n=1 Tax=Aspergillus pseudonomiae TaxID=1506151 RepID=A0A5N7DAB0_9EURO|nr:uncharacterized protein BDV37DRAFT_283971 [Aspergillus pseudonomiae]KAE8403174.1 hypothetical protein BDV37DRAFT_283971 [Aspergillus pseudonomiae]